MTCFGLGLGCCDSGLTFLVLELGLKRNLHLGLVGLNLGL